MSEKLGPVDQIAEAIKRGAKDFGKQAAEELGESVTPEQVFNYLIREWGDVYLDEVVSSFEGTRAKKG